MTKYLYAGSAQGKHYFINKKENCNIVMFWEYIPEHAKSGASPYKKMEYYEKSPKHVTVVHHSDHGEEERQEWKSWNMVWEKAQPKLVERMVVKETPRVVSDAPKREPRVVDPTMIAKIKQMQFIADVEREYARLLEKHRINWTKDEKIWLRDNQTYVPVELRKRLKEALTGRKAEDNIKCPFC